MPRKPRQYIIAPGSFYHVVARGNNERRIFRSSRDYRKFLRILEDTKKKFPFYLYSYNLIPNHYHFEIETQDISISKIMHRINFLYASYFHRRHKTSGHLFQGRFFSNLISKESYFWEVARYIDLNAVRAGVAKRPEDYKWGSYLVYFQENHNENLIDRDRFLEYGGEDLEKSRLTYLKFIEEGMEKERAPKFPFNEKMI